MGLCPRQGVSQPCRVAHGDSPHAAGSSHGCVVDIAESESVSSHSAGSLPRADRAKGAVVEHHHTTVDYRHDRLFYSGPAPRLYFYLKHHRPHTLRGWLSFLGYELQLLGQDLLKVARPIAVATLRVEIRRWPGLAVRLFNILSGRLAIPWLLWHAHVQRLKEAETL